MSTVQETARDWAQSYLDAQMADYLLTAPGPVKTAEMARHLGDTVGASARLVRNQLNQSAGLMLVERRWDLRSRHDLRPRPMEGFVRWLLKEHGRPLNVAQLAGEMSLLRGHSQDYYYSALHRLVATRPDYFVTWSGQCGLREWLIDLTSRGGPPGQPADEETLRRHNFFLRETDLDAELKALDLDYPRGVTDPLEAAVALLETSSRPVLNKVLGYAVWKVLQSPFDPVELFDLLLEDERAALLPGPRWCTPAVLAAIQEAVVEWSLEVDEAAAVEDQVDMEEALGQELAGETTLFSLSEEDLKEVARVLEENKAPTSLATLVTDVFELFPGDPPYIQSLQRLHDRLNEDERFVLLGDHQWYLRALLPPTLFRVPVTLEPSPIRVTSLTGEVMDALLNDEGLEGFLAFEVHAPDMEDIGEEQEVGEIKAGTKLVAKVRYVTNYRHYVAGTLKIRKIDRGVFPVEPAILPLRLTDGETGRTFEAWLNNETGLLCGLTSWYSEQLPPAGGIFFAEVTPSGAIRLTIQTEPDPYLFIPPTRIEELLLLREQWEHDSNMSVLDLMRQIMSEYLEGVSFRKLYSELNVVRRVTKRLVASNLSSYPMFQPHSVEEGLWVYEAGKANRPRVSAKRAYIMSESA